MPSGIPLSIGFTMGHGGQSPPLLGWTQMINAIFLSPCNRYWYVTAYKVDKAIILKGPRPFAHTFVMETKEHLVIMLLLMPPMAGPARLRIWR